MLKAQLHSVNEFLEAIPSLPRFKNVSKGQLMGFKSLMKSRGKMYVFNLRDYIPALTKYLTK